MCFHITFRVQGLNLNFHWDVSLTPLLTRNIKKTTKMMLLSHTSWHECVCLCLCEAVRVCLQVYFTIKLIFCFFYFKFFENPCQETLHRYRLDGDKKITVDPNSRIFDSLCFATVVENGFQGFDLALLRWKRASLLLAARYSRAST